MQDVISCRLDSTGLHAITERARRFNKRTPAVACNVALHYVARQARVETHKLSVPTSRIDAELSVTVTPRISARTGRPVSRNTRNPNNVTAHDERGVSVIPPIPFAALIITARMRPGSNYNQLTGGRWLINNTLGFTQKQLTHPRVKAWIAATRFARDAISRMVNRRHSASGFIQSGWLAAIAQGEPFVPAKYRRLGIGDAPRGETRRVNADHGGFTPAVEGSEIVTGSIENRAGMSGGNGILDQKRNEALWRVGEPALADAIAIQARKTAEYVAEQEAQTAFSNLRQHGLIYSH